MLVEIAESSKFDGKKKIYGFCDEYNVIYIFIKIILGKFDVLEMKARFEYLHKQYESYKKKLSSSKLSGSAASPVTPYKFGTLMNFMDKRNLDNHNDSTQ